MRSSWNGVWQRHPTLRWVFERIALAILFIPFLFAAVVCGVWSWIGEARQVWWRVQSFLRTFHRVWRETRDPGVHAREWADQMMPTNQRRS